MAKADFSLFYREKMVKFELNIEFIEKNLILITQYLKMSS